MAVLELIIGKFKILNIIFLFTQFNEIFPTFQISWRPENARLQRGGRDRAAGRPHQETRQAGGGRLPSNLQGEAKCLPQDKSLTRMSGTV